MKFAYIRCSMTEKEIPVERKSIGILNLKPRSRAFFPYVFSVFTFGFVFQVL